MKLDENIVCVVTGGASGLGYAAVFSLLAKGCKVVIADFNKVNNQAFLFFMSKQGKKL